MVTYKYYHDNFVLKIAFHFLHSHSFFHRPKAACQEFFIPNTGNPFRFILVTFRQHWEFNRKILNFKKQDMGANFDRLAYSLSAHRSVSDRSKFKWNKTKRTRSGLCPASWQTTTFDCFWSQQYSARSQKNRPTPF